jgi:hypothetical protein
MNSLNPLYTLKYLDQTTTGFNYFGNNDRIIPEPNKNTSCSRLGANPIIARFPVIKDHSPNQINYFGGTSQATRIENVASNEANSIASEAKSLKDKLKDYETEIKRWLEAYEQQPKSNTKKIMDASIFKKLTNIKKEITNFKVLYNGFFEDKYPNTLAGIEQKFDTLIEKPYLTTLAAISERLRKKMVSQEQTTIYFMMTLRMYLKKTM